jgi:hypothetical protein
MAFRPASDQSGPGTEYTQDAFKEKASDPETAP